MAILDYSLNTTVGPTGEVVTLAEAKQQLRVTGTGDDEHINRLIQAARELVERDASLSLLTQTVVEKRDEFPTNNDEAMVLHRPPLQSVTSIQYIDEAGSTQTMSTGDYEVDTVRTPGAVWLTADATWPSEKSIQNAVTITYKTGYTAVAGVPEKAKQAILLMVEALYDGCEIPQAYHLLVDSLNWGTYA